MSIDNLLHGIIKVIIRYHNYQVEKHSSEAERLKIRLYPDDLGSRIALSKAPELYSTLQTLIENTNKLYKKRTLHLQCLLSLHRNISDILSNPSDQYELQVESVGQVLSQYFKAIVILTNTTDRHSDPITVNSHSLNSLVGQYLLTYDTSDFGQALRDYIIQPLKFSLDSNDKEIKAVIDVLKIELITLIQIKLAKSESSKHKDELLEEISGLKQQLSAKDEVIASLLKENQKLKEKPCSITDAFSFYSSATLPENKDKQEVVTATL